MGKITALIEQVIRALRNLVDRLLGHKGHRVAEFAHRAENPLHVAYLSGVAFGGGYRYAAMFMLLCMFIAWLLSEH
jgi:hypothetical protein